MSDKILYLYMYIKTHRVSRNFNGMAGTPIFIDLFLSMTVIIENQNLRMMDQIGVKVEHITNSLGESCADI